MNANHRASNYNEQSEKISIDAPTHYRYPVPLPKSKHRKKRVSSFLCKRHRHLWVKNGMMVSQASTCQTTKSMKTNIVRGILGSWRRANVTNNTFMLSWSLVASDLRRELKGTITSKSQCTLKDQVRFDTIMMFEREQAVEIRRKLSCDIAWTSACPALRV